MRVAVTGASGFIGGHVGRRLVDEGHQVFSFGRRAAADLDWRRMGEYRSWDIGVGALKAAPEVDAVVHCAGAVSDWGPREEFERTNVGGTRAVLSSFPAAAVFVHMSTASVYDSLRRKSMIREDEAVEGSGHLNDYARTKWKAELEVRQTGRRSVILRPHVVYGPGDTLLLPRVLAARRFGAQLAFGDGRNRLSVTHIDNLVDAVSLALNWRGATKAFNISDAEPTTVDELMRELLRALALHDRIVYIPRALAWPLASALELGFRATRSRRPPALTRYAVLQMSSEYTLDITRVRNHLGYRPSRDFHDGFSELAAHAMKLGPAP